jgi:PhoH-like ATPase
MVYVLDTNILVYDPEALFAFKHNEIVIPATVVEELDSFKSEMTERGRNAREAIRHLDALRSQGSLAEGVQLPNAGRLRVVFAPPVQADAPFSFSVGKADNEILRLLVWLKHAESGRRVCLLTHDLNMRIKADVLGIASQDYAPAVLKRREFYTGFVELQVPAIQLKKQIPPALLEYAQEYAFTLHEAAIIYSQHNPHNYRVFRYIGGGHFKAIELQALSTHLQVRNPQQLIALDLLLDPTIPLVTLIGPAGTGKTFLALAAAFESVVTRQTYEKMLITRPVVPLGHDVGYLPGSLQEKLFNWMQPIYDNMEFLMHLAASAPAPSLGVYKEGQEGEHQHRKQKKHKRQHEQKALPLSVEALQQKGKLTLEAITYMRGRSIPYQYILIDEVQNLTPHEVKTLVSRVGEGSKIILAGDPYQIDASYLDFSSNGLMVTAQKLKGQPLCAMVYMPHTERSTLSALASKLL